MKTTLKMAERKRALKVTGFHESLGGFGKKLLAGMGKKKVLNLRSNQHMYRKLYYNLEERKYSWVMSPL